MSSRVPASARPGWQLLVLVLALAGLPGSALARPLLVFAAASLKNALDAVNLHYAQLTGHRAVISYAGSSALAKQIAAGAPADLFISANIGWMDYLQRRHLIRSATRRALLGNHLVLVAPRDGPLRHVVVRPGFPLLKLLGGGRLAMAQTNAVPAGIYGEAALKTLGVWSAVESRIAQAENVRAALALVARGEAPLGIVYKTDAAVEPNVRIVGTFPDDTHPPIIYPAAVTAVSRDPQAARFLAYLESAQARPLFARAGFIVLTRR